MKVNSHKLDSPGYPQILMTIADPPRILYWQGAEPSSWLKLPKVGIVGSRTPTTYGQEITYKFALALAAEGAVIVSGLAFGIDSIAHKAALDAGGLTVAILPGSLETIYPASHRGLAQQILASGGTLISEYPPGTNIMAHNFIARNRLISGLSDVVLITQAAKNSGSLHTANFALEQAKTVMSVPGDITIALNAGNNNLIKSGALVANDVEDIWLALGFKSRRPKRSSKVFKGSQEQQAIFDLIRRGISAQDELAAASGLDGAAFSSALTMLELAGYIRAEGAGYWATT